MRGWWLLAFLAFTAGTTPAQQPVTLQKLEKIARERFKTNQPKQLAALEPFLEDLKLSYNRDNREWLDSRFAMAAELGDSIVPALLTRLTPADPNDPVDRNVASNSARILLRIDPSGFSDSLIEIARGESYTARAQAIWLLGYTRSREAVAVLTQLLDDTNTPQRIRIIGALKRMGAMEPAPKIAALLRSETANLRDVALDYLAEMKPPSALPSVLEALAAEQAPEERLRDYVRYLQGAAPRNAAAADALLARLDPNGIDRDQLLMLARALATVAPADHRPTIERCERILELGEVGELGLACAVTMSELGDRSGFGKLESRLTSLTRRERDNDAHFRRRGDVYRAQGKWREAANDYEEAVEKTEAFSLKRDLWLLVARCEAHRERWSAVRTALEKSQATYRVIMQAAAEDSALQNALSQTTVQRFLQKLPKEKPGPGDPTRPKKR